MKKYPTPAVTRSYRSREVIDAKESFSLDSMLARLRPTPEEFEAIFRASVISNARKTGDGSRRGFPAPADFIDALFGFEYDGEPAWSDKDNHLRSIKLWRAASRMIEHNRNGINAMWAAEATTPCPICDATSIHVILGFGLIWHESMEIVGVDHSALRMLDVTINCPCRGFNIDDYALIEDMARECVFERMVKERNGSLVSDSANSTG